MKRHFSTGTYSPGGPIRPAHRKAAPRGAFGTRQALDRPAALATGPTSDPGRIAEQCLRSVARAPLDPDVLTIAADALRTVGRFREALVQFDRALALDSNRVAAWFGRALALEASGALEEAVHSYRQVTRLAPRAAPGFAGLASALSKLGSLEEARRNADQAVALGPDESSVAIARARCDVLAGDHAAAVRRLRKLTRRPDLPANDAVVATTMLGDALDRLGDADEAFAAYSRANRRFLEANVAGEAPPVATMLVEQVGAAIAALKPVARTRPN